MNKFLTFISVIILHLILSQFLPWWNIIPAAMIPVFFLERKASGSFWWPFIGIVLCWGVWILWLDSSSGFHLSDKIAGLLNLAAPFAYLLACIAGGLVAGLSGLFIYLLKGVFEKSK